MTIEHPRHPHHSQSDPGLTDNEKDYLIRLLRAEANKQDKGIQDLRNRFGSDIDESHVSRKLAKIEFIALIAGKLAQ